MDEPGDMTLSDIKPDSKGRILHDLTHRKSLGESRPQRQRVDGESRVWGGGDGESMLQGDRVSGWGAGKF